MGNFGAFNDCGAGKHGGNRYIYGGVYEDGKAMGQEPGAILFILFDLPFSFAFDTLTLPITIASTIGGRDPGIRPTPPAMTDADP